MKTLYTSAIVALMTTTLGLSAVAPAMAQTAIPTENSQAAKPAEANGFRPGKPGNDGPRHGGGMGELLGFERGAEAIEIALVRLSHRLELTTEQQTLLATLKTDALSAAETFATTTEGLRPTPPTEGETVTPPTFGQRLDNQIALEKARLAALEAVRPSAKAFFDSLSEEQVAQLAPPQGKFGGPGNGGHHRPGPHGAPGMNGMGEMGGDDVAPPAPPAPAPQG
ncbi:Spy/CpxP family protein refolding chaperone [Devosia sp. 63-57]|uniref:Spy/CpxP family protein refolding chaperone n=1 Tax=Devosia sp. 63-57 TaxID=1895751 RepID=UPI0008689F85|nr:Spy/CpxP family protein refolding chaperone [Devosia sp. 63-57]ODT50462.1 MAG: hypothetical protein ABS74_02780 [Pelagibacterium sp. SCN 63-126]ODU88542.1 MAG: hypothetical protein ABT14_02380 [Pelagibacterium sp. SCN 63-17]OJX45587.1 MAG: hypothetical protein BGO80_07265 [Devosia sp. 63-57]